MAPARAARKQLSREADYSNIGVAGRKTGVTLKDSGVRDEHGLEPIDGIFSSPERPKSKRKTNGTSMTITDDESMDIGQSTIPEPTEVLTSGRITLPPPRSRSPIKTNLGSSPRRSVGPPSSPSKLSGQALNGGSNSISSPRHTRPSPLRSVERPSRDPDESIVAISPLKSVKRRKDLQGRSSAGAPLKSVKRRKISDKIAKEVFDISITEDEQDSAAADPNSSRIDDTIIDDLDLGETGGRANTADNSLSMDISGNMPTDESAMEQVEEPELEARHEPQDTMEAEVETTRPPKRKPGRPRKSDTKVLSSAKPVATEVQKPTTKGRRGRPPKNKVPGTVLPEAVEETADTIEEKTAKKKKKNPSKAETSTSPRNQKKPPPSQRSRGARISSSGENKRAVTPQEQAESSKTLERGKPRSRGLLMLRSETPADDYGAQVLRSGRTSVKPLAYWRSEKIIYGDARKEGNFLSLPGIKEVIRTEEMLPPPSRRGKGSKRGPKAGGRRAQAVIEEEDEDAEEWELDTGVVGGEVMQWDPVQERGSEQDLEEIELAYAPKGLGGLIREVKNATFLYGKTVTLPFFHSGIVDLPPRAEKRMKNSRKNHMVFWVSTGRVDVNVSNNEFSVGAGGMWQVPRGNFYSLQNPHSRPSRVFFAQGCFMDGNEERAEGGNGQQQ